ncbi:BQ2448_5511 [Microbotryum intermedium]|uniref:BQ2448_5511 protein n=1 Tax=Microbotryum intermedium TaxID=269621 RepID=A0A238F153_9BASI|nr:BQ2448_5511 [Microbotryum intermedium]
MSSTSASVSTTHSSSATPPTIKVHVKGPSDTKLTLSIATSATVLELKQAIAAEAAAFPADSQRLIYSGRVLKDEDELEKYKLKDGHSIHLVKGAPKTGLSGTPGTSAAAGVPANFAAGQQVMGNPLAPLLNAENAGHFAGFNPFADMGVNPNDPNYVQTAMRDPAVQQQINSLLSNPAVIDQIIASNPELQAMGPQVRQIMQSEHFRTFLTNPEAMQQMASMMGGGGAGGLGGAGGFPPPGAFGWGSGATAQGQGQGQGQGQQGQAAGGLFNPWASTTPATTTPDSAATTNNAAAAPPAAGTLGAFNPFAAFGGGAGAGAGAGAGGQPNMAQMMAQMQALQQMGMGMGFGGNGGGAAGAQSSVPPEERFQTQLAQLQGMGFYDASKNIRALLASGGNVEAAIEYLFSNP